MDGYRILTNGLLIQTVQDSRSVSLSQWNIIGGTVHYPIPFTQKPFVAFSLKGGGGCVLSVSDAGVKKESLSYDVLFVAYSGMFSGARFLLIGF